MVAISPAGFVERLVETVPSLAPTVAEHLHDYDQLLIHLLMSDVLRFATAQFAAGDVGASAQTLEVVAAALTDGDEDLRNAVEVSFVEEVGAWDAETSEFIASWPQVLLDELDEQMSWYNNPR